MIITKISDGFGNQMFMFACGYASARRLGTRLMLDISYLETNSMRSYELDKLNIYYDKIFTTKHLKFYILKVLYRKVVHALMHIFFRFYHEKRTYVYDEKLSNIKDNTYLFGYWQTEKYFRNYRTDLMRMFTPNYEPSNECLNYIRLVQNCNSVAVHIRRGDYVNLGICLDRSYYENAFKKMEEQYNTVKYFIFSDDIDYAKQMFQKGDRDIVYVQYSSQNSTLEDFFIMKNCKHIIMANSTFSWWAAWLNDNPDKIVIFPATKLAASDFYPSQWIMIN